MSHLDVVGKVIAVHGRGKRAAGPLGLSELFSLDVEIASGPGWRAGMEIRLVSTGGDVSWPLPVLDQPPGADDLRAGPWEMGRLQNVGNQELLSMIGEAAEAHDVAQELCRIAARTHAENLQGVDSARHLARQLAAELARRLAS